MVDNNDRVSAMYIDISPNDNVDDSAMATFKETGPSRAIIAARLWRDERWQWCAITGWNESGSSSAFATAIEESGDGPALLLHGGEHGLRLSEIGSADLAAAVNWSLEDRGQWGEPFLICRPDTQLRTAP
jgi:hypothetical protein